MEQKRFDKKNLIVLAAVLLLIAIVAVIALYWLFTTPIEWGVNV